MRIARARFDHGQPIHRPDSMPILLFVFALIAGLTIMNKQQAHALLVDLPPAPPPGYIGVLTPGSDRLTIAADDTLRWNGTVISNGQLEHILTHGGGRDPQTALLFAPDGDARYLTVARTLLVIHKAGLIDRCFRFSGIARYRRYDLPETFATPTSAEFEECAFAPDH